MSVRVSVALGALVLAGCGLVSGLDSLSIEGGVVLPDATADVGADVAQDVSAPPDVTTTSDAAEAGPRAATALQSKGGCATAAGTTALALANDNFTVELWLRLDAPTASTELDPILWKGGRASSEPGWTLALQGSALAFCVADLTGAKCTSSYPMVLGHLVHVGVRSQFSQSVQNSRSVTLYARDVSAGDASHAVVGTLSGAANTWITSATFTVGGATTTNACASASSFTIDDVRVYSTVQSPLSMDNNMSVDVSCSLSTLLADYTFNEGSGALAADCTANAFNLTLGQNQKFIPSPFP